MVMSKVELRDAICNRVVPEVFLDVVTECTCHIRISREVFGEDNQICFWMLKEYLLESPGWDWIEWFNDTENGHEAVGAWSDHYNGQMGLSKRTHLSLTTLKMLRYKKYQSMVFDKYSEITSRDLRR